MSVTFFDFDGCLVDTAHECAVVSWCVREGISADFDAVKVEQRFLERFYEIKPYVRYAREYVVFQSGIYEEVSTEADLRRVLAESLTEAEGLEYAEQFYATREAMKDESSCSCGVSSRSSTTSPSLRVRRRIPRLAKQRLAN